MDNAYIPMKTTAHLIIKEHVGCFQNNCVKAICQCSLRTLDLEHSNSVSVWAICQCSTVYYLLIICICIYITRFRIVHCPLFPLWVWTWLVLIGTQSKSMALSDHNCHYITILNYIGVISPFHSNYIIQLVTHSLIIHLVILRNILFILFNLMQ